MQIKSRERVQKYGEVFTAPREVNAMLDLVKPETERIDATFLDPACGEGAFLTEILRRKLAAVLRQSDYAYAIERNSLIALASVYGIDIQADNILICREILCSIWTKFYRTNCEAIRNPHGPQAEMAARSIIQHNIVLGDTLSMKAPNGDQLKISQWICEPERGSFRRLDYLFRSLIEENQDLFSFGPLYEDRLYYRLTHKE